MSPAKRDRRRVDIAKFLDTLASMRIPPGDPNEQAIWVILARHGTKEGATKACKALWSRFVGVNEFRVAKATEIADIIERHVKNDPIAAAEQARGYLRVFFKEWQTVDPAPTESRTPDQLRRYLASLDEHAAEIALALALHYAAQEVAEQASFAEVEGDGKARKRPERDITTVANRLRLLFACAAHGTVSTKLAQTNASRAFVKAWAYKPLPKAPAAAPAPAKKKAPKAARKKAPTKSTKTTKASKPAKTTKKSPGKKVTRKTRPRTARKTTRKPATTKKSSRR